MNSRNLWIAIVAIVLLEALFFASCKQVTESKLEALAISTLASSGIELTEDQVDFTGRDVTLTGVIHSEESRARAHDLLMNMRYVDGGRPDWANNRQVVRRVHDNMMLASAADTDMPDAEAEAPEVETEEPAAPAPVSSTFSLAGTADNNLTLTGVLPAEAIRADIVGSVEAAYPGATIIDQMTVDAAVASSDWLDNLKALLPTAGLLSLPGITIDGTSIRLSGRVAGEPQLNAVLADARAAISPPYTLTPDLSILAQTPSGDNDELDALRERIAGLLAVSNVQFELNTADLTAASRDLLDNVAVALNEWEDVQVEVQGHTDNSGSIAINNTLSQLRAESVRNYLISKGVAESRLTAVGFGPRRPVATNTTREGRILNRRVEFNLSGGQ